MARGPPLVEDEMAQARRTGAPDRRCLSGANRDRNLAETFGAPFLAKGPHPLKQSEKACSVATSLGRIFLYFRQDGADGAGRYQFERKKSRLMALLESVAMRSVYGPALAKLYASRRDRINNDLKLIFENNIGKVAMEYVARPATDSKVRRFSLETDLLKKGAEEGYNAIRRYVDALTTTARVG
jgi:hypothetical protein